MTLSEEIKKLQEEIKEKESRIRKLKEKEPILETLDNNFDAVISLLEVLFPLHDRTSCDVIHILNPGRCNRCTILQMKEDGMWNDNYILKISIDKIS